ncbi:MAG: PorV/PorQ family protein [Candidatus Riflebacteria bacterium]|nr:PorV/PorQ family protein [Candidatus Riflebacteria bacterium]
MKSIFKTLLLIALISATAVSAHAADSAGQAGAYLKMGVGARALGMGGAFTAVADDSTAAFWNPAGLARMQKSQASFMHASLTEDRDFNFFNYAHALTDKNGNSKGVLAFSYIHMGVDGIPETRESTNSPGMPATKADGTYTAGETVYIFSYFEDKETNTFASYARELAEGFYAGVNVKYLKHELFKNKADTFGLDLGLLYEYSDKITFGASLRDINETLEWNTASGAKDDVPLTATFGIAYKATDKLLVAADINKLEREDAKLFLGAEYAIQDNVSLRVGSRDGDLTLGASFGLDTWRFDYSYGDETLGDAHRISASKTF